MRGLFAHHRYTQPKQSLNKSLSGVSASWNVFNRSCCLFSLVAMLFLTACSFSPNEGVKNLKLQQVPKARLTYVAIGASDTFGYGTEDPATQSWPFDLSHKLGSDVHLVNLGIPGIDAHQALDLELPVALDAHPDLVTVWLAVNDLVDKVPPENYRNDLNTLFNRLQSAAPHARIVVANVPDLTFVPRFHTTNQVELRKKVNDYNAIIADVVQSHQVTLVDLYIQWQALATHPEYISADGFHPSAIGYAQLADIFYQTLHT